jgi:hypothetical protein
VCCVFCVRSVCLCCVSCVIDTSEIKYRHLVHYIKEIVQTNHIKCIRLFPLKRSDHMHYFHLSLCVMIYRYVMIFIVQVTCLTRCMLSLDVDPWLNLDDQGAL